MKKSLKLKISNALSSNCDFNRKIICMKHSWDEVREILCKCDKCKPKGCKCNKKY